ncbi:hypothetical protein R8510_03038 [Ralstonia chuxiongensis]|nr:hypothetical protein R8510_03038 [Ralstonia chuxiongensis]
MQTFSFQKGTVLQVGDATVKIVRVVADGAVVLENVLTGYTHTLPQEALLDQYRDGKLVAQPRVEASRCQLELYRRPLDELPDAVKAEAFRRKRYLDYVSEAGTVAWHSDEMKALLRAAAQKFGDKKPPSTSTVYGWYCRQARANDIRALVPCYRRRGPRTAHTNAEVLELLARALEGTAKAQQRWSMLDVKARLSEAVERENAARTPERKLTMPTLRTLYRLADRLQDYGIELEAPEYSRRRRTQRLVKDQVRTTRILERVEIDHTPVDVFVVDPETYLPCGRPWLTMLIDHYSRMPLGYFLSFGSPSERAVLGAMRHAILPKRPAESVIPGLQMQHAWPCYGLMSTLVADNGREFYASGFDNACFDLNIEPLYCPVRKPRFKGTIERFLKTINYGFAHTLPGTTLAHFIERGDYDPEKHAVLTLAELQHALEKWLLDIYAQDVHRLLNAVPYEVWTASARDFPPYLPEEAIDLIHYLGARKTRRLHSDGITLDNILYCDEALSPILLRYGAGVSLRVMRDAENLGRILVWAPNEQDHIVVPAVWQDYAEGLTLVQHKMITALARQNNRDTRSEQALTDAKRELAQGMQTLVNSRKLRDRKKAAATHGATSEHPTRRLGASDTAKAMPRTRPGEPLDVLPLPDVEAFPRIPLR